MKKLWVLLLLLTAITALYAQQPGDTLVVKAFKYGSTSRDSMIAFPSGNLTFEKIILKYNMRCKNALVSTQTAPDQGCGEWDYSCNTFIVDSTQIEEVPGTHPSHTITNFSGGTFYYTTNQLFDLYRFRQTGVTVDSILSETQAIVGAGTSAVPQVLKTDEQSGRSLVLFTQSELLSAGFSAGAIDGIILSVANTGGAANFFQVGFKHTTDSLLNPDSLSPSGFSRVYNHHYTFLNGANRIQFHTPFLWDGISNLILEFSFTNTVPGSPVILNGHSTSLPRSLSANNNYALDLSASALVNINTSYLGSIGNEISVGFRAFGHPDLLPANTSILYGYAGNSSQRHLNIHLPWANGNIYFDCGYSGGYDRINKAATTSEYEGQWNHWVFTKNAATGNMSIYCNGIVWHSGTGMTKPISLLNLMLGNNQTLTNNYKGKINDLTIWDKALTPSEIFSWRNQPVDPTHPSYSNLVAYYKADEGTGSILTDAKNNAVSTGTGMQWTFDRGDRIGQLFSESMVRPNIVFLRGNYLLDTTLFYAMDSVMRNPNTVKAYTITPAPAGTLQDDAVTLVSTSQVYHASPILLWDGDADTLISSDPVTPEDSIQITTLNYIRRYPYYNEIMSFVTPYGKGLDLGVEGKTWFFDVTDFTPLLKGDKRMMLTGGVWQEELDIDFWFIVGTPPRDVLEFKQLWQGNARAGNASIASINNNIRFAPVTVPLHQDGERFKIRSTITGHGNEGEFQQNGGSVNHYLSVNSTSNDFSWQISEECSFNPVFPQGGTWVYDRQGWCPGQYSLLKEFDLTNLVSPGNNATIDYQCSAPQISTGDYRYIVAMQLVTYGEANHNLDAALVDVAAPSDKVVYSRQNPVCANPELMVENTGATPISSLEINYWLNNATTKQTYLWSDTLAPSERKKIILPTGTLWDHDYLTSGNIFRAALVKANGTQDDYSFNNSCQSAFSVSDRISRRFIVEFRTNNIPSQNSYSIEDEAGNIVPGASLLTSANTFYRDTFELDGCFKLKVTDSGNDGLQWWANTTQGSGYVRLKKANGVLIKTFESDFGGGFEYSFSTIDDTGIEEADGMHDPTLWPNPAKDHFTLEGLRIGRSNLQVCDFTGRQIPVPMERGTDKIEFDTRNLPKGVYFIILNLDSGTVVKKVVIH